MAVTLSVASQNAACDAVVSQLNAGTIELQDATNVVVATLTLANPAFAAAANGTASANAIGADTNTGAGTVDKAVFKDSVGTEIFRVSVSDTAGTGDIKFPNPTFAAGEKAEITSYDHTQPAS